MEILLKRIAKKDKYTVGHLYINGHYFSDTIEDKDRGLSQSMTLQDILRKKHKEITAIPTGSYEITLNMISPRFGNKTFYKIYANGGRLPRLLNVKGFDGVLIHCGNNAEDSAGCIIIGQNKEVGKVLRSKETFQKFYPLLQRAKGKGEKITLKIE